MTKPLRVLVLEDSALDAEMFIRELRRAGFDPDWKRVETKADFQAALDSSPDLILSDYSLPHFDGVRAVQLLRERGLDTPFILISGTLGEEAAVEAMKLGATDYLLKDRIARLGSAVERALDEQRLRHERTRAEQARRESDARWRLATTGAGMGTWDRDFLTNRIIWSAEQEQLMGYERGTFPGTYEAFYELVHPEDRGLLVAAQARARQESGVYRAELRFRLRDGRVRWGLVLGHLMHDESGHPLRMVGVDLDITERKLAEEALQASERAQRKLTCLLESERERLLEAQALAKVGSWETDPSTLAVTWSAETFRIFETSLDRFQPTHEGFLQLVHPEDRNGVARAFQESLQNPAPCVIQHRLLLPDGRLKDVEERWQTIFDHHGKPLRAIGTCQDITERKLVEAQLRQFNEELERRVADRTAQMEEANHELDSFSHSVSHDLRAPLRTISGFGRFLGEECASTLDERGRGYLRRMMDAAAQMSRLIDDLLQFAHSSRRELRRQSVDLSALAQEVVRDLQQASPERQVQFLCAPDLNVSGDARLLRVVLVNLLGNAWKYTGKTAQPRVEFGRQGGGGETSFFIRDNGAGFDMQYVDRLFGAFQRLHSMAEFEGAGVGLATVQRIIHRHGGKIRAEAKVNEGAAFYFTLPESPGPQPVELRRAERSPATTPFSP